MDRRLVIILGGLLLGTAVLTLSGALPAGATRAQPVLEELNDDHDSRSVNRSRWSDFFDGATTPEPQNGTQADSSDDQVPLDPSDEEPRDADTDSLAVAVLALLVGLAGGGCAGWAANQVSTRRAGSIRPGTAGHDSAKEEIEIPRHTMTAPPLSADTAEATVVPPLVDGLIACYDLATNDAQRARVRETLEFAGVTSIEPDVLTPFDPKLHHALSVRPDNDPARAGLIASTERPGWSRHGQLMRPPEVIVYPLPERTSRR